VRILMLVASALFLGSCQGEDPATCPPAGPLVSGAYVSSGIGTWHGTRGSFPHDNDQPKVLQLDREAGRLRITYRRDGQEVVETWRVMPALSDPPTDASAD
jgi:hypothetical protein